MQNKKYKNEEYQAKETDNKGRDSWKGPFRKMNQLTTLLLVFSLIIGWFGGYLFVLSLIWNNFPYNTSYVLASFTTLVFGISNVKLYQFIFLQ